MSDPLKALPRAMTEVMNIFHSDTAAIMPSRQQLALPDDKVWACTVEKANGSQGRSYIRFGSGTDNLLNMEYFDKDGKQVVAKDDVGKVLGNAYSRLFASSPVWVADFHDQISGDKNLNLLLRAEKPATDGAPVPQLYIEYIYPYVDNLTGWQNDQIIFNGANWVVRGTASCIPGTLPAAK